jgi:dephospho-CoA kinase
MLTQPNLVPPNYPLERIAFAGPMCVGKTFLANILVEEFGYTKQSFASVLKDIVGQLYGPMNKDDGGRKLLQEFSADLKKWDPQLFITHLLRQSEAYLEDYMVTGDPKDHLLVVDDLRYLAEYEALKKNGYTIIGVTCSESVRMDRILKLYPDTTMERFTHPSETEWKIMKIDYWLNTTLYEGEVELRSMINRRKSNEV